MLGRIDEKLLPALDDLAAYGMDERELLDFVAPELQAERELLVRGVHLDAIAADPELAGLQRHVISVVLDAYQPGQHLVAVDHLANPQGHHGLAVVLGRADAVDARDAGHDDHVAAADQGAGGRQAQPFDVLVDRGVLLDVNVALRDVGLRLVVVVIAHKIVDGVVGEELFELGIHLGGQRLVVRDDQRRPLKGLDDVGHDERLARPGHPHAHHVLVAAAERLDNLPDDLGLVPLGFKGANELELHGRAPATEAIAAADPLRSCWENAPKGYPLLVAGDGPASGSPMSQYIW